MVTVIDYALRKSQDGHEFVSLKLQGDLTMVQSQVTGRFYATAKSCSITSTFTEEQAKLLIGRTIPGRIVKVECEEFSYTIEETGEVIPLRHRWEYQPEEAPTALRVVHKELAA